MGDTRKDRAGRRFNSINGNCLGSVQKEGLHPGEKRVPDAGLVEFGEKETVVDFVEGFRKVKKDGVNLLVIVETVGEVT